MRAGMLNRRITLQEREAAADAIGQPSPVWLDVATVWADIRLSSGLGMIKADAVSSIVQASIRIRYRDGVNAGMRVVHGATVYAIKAVLPDAAGKRYADLACEVSHG